MPWMPPPAIVDFADSLEFLVLGYFLDFPWSMILLFKSSTLQLHYKISAKFASLIYIHNASCYTSHCSPLFSYILGLPLAWCFYWSNYQSLIGHLNACSSRVYKSFMSKNILFHSDSLSDILAGEFESGTLSEYLAFQPLFPMLRTCPLH